MSIAPHAITSLTLENFRNYRSLSLTLGPEPVVLRGQNGAGKTNILEAISMLSPGRGLRSAKLSEMDCIGVASPLSSGEREGPAQWEGEGAFRQSVFINSPLTQPSPPRGEGRIANAPWVVAAELTARGEHCFIGTGRDGEATTEKRIIKINGERVKSHAQLAAHTCIQWLTPSMDQVFIEGGTARRKFFDRLVYGFTPEHAARVTAYEGAMRERNKLLGDGRAHADPYWLSVLEQQMAEHAVAITLARLEMLDRLRVELMQDIAGFPRAELQLQGAIERWLVEEGLSALEIEQKFAERLMSLRGVDAARGRASEGPQRSEWIVVHSFKQMEAGNCSTGEQKALILSILLASARARANWCGVAPILLLDEVIAHLDVDKRACLFDLIRQCRIQAWMTGTDAADFKGLEGISTQLEIDGGMVKM